MTYDEWLRLFAGTLMMMGIVGGIIWAVRPGPYQWRRRIPVELKRALAVVLAAGYGVERKGVHLYPRGRGFAVLKFDGKGDVVAGEGGVDEVHPDADRAIARHFEVAGPPPEVVKTAWGEINI